MLLGKPKGRGVGRPPKPYQVTTLREFDGGWNVIDNELNLAPKFARIFDNVVRGTDGSVSVRYGSKLWADLRLGTELYVTLAGNAALVHVQNSRRVTLTNVSSLFAVGNHIKFPNNNQVKAVETGLGLVGSLVDKEFAIYQVGSDMAIDLDSPATTTGASQSIASMVVYKDTHIVGSELVNGTYFGGKLVVVSNLGEIIAVDDQKAAVKIWGNALSYAQAGNPVGWGHSDYVIFNPSAGSLQVHNGRDKPVEINFDRSVVCQYLIDPASVSNAFVPIGDVVTTNAGYTIISNIKTKPRVISISAHYSPGVYFGNPNPDDALEVDISKVSSSDAPTIIGLAELRGKLIVAMRDNIVIGSLGNVTTTGDPPVPLHEPEFKDAIPQHGTISQRTMVGLGNDLFMCDRVGVPSVAKSQQTGELQPNRVSKLIGPAIQLNLSRLSDATLRQKAFAVYNVRDSQYMLFIPKYDTNDKRYLPDDPIIFLDHLGRDTFMVHAPAHSFDEGDSIEISGSTDADLNTATEINKTWTVNTVIDEDYFTVKNPGYAYTSINISGGGPNVSIKPLTEAMIGYILKYDPEMRIRAWSRFTGLNFKWGARSLQGRMFFGKGAKIYEFGTPEHPYSADEIGDYDDRFWYPDTVYPEGRRIIYNDSVYISNQAHTSSSLANMGLELSAYPDRWTAYKGKPIKFVWELPWGDFDTRVESKLIKSVFCDTTGKGRFTLQIFVDQIYKDLETGKLTPVRSIPFVAGSAGGFGAGSQSYGGGRRTREQLIWPTLVIGMLHKFRIEGETTDPIRFIAITIVYGKGSMKR